VKAINKLIQASVRHFKGDFASPAEIGEDYEDEGEKTIAVGKTTAKYGVFVLKERIRIGGEDETRIRYRQPNGRFITDPKNWRKRSTGVVYDKRTGHAIAGLKKVRK